MPGAERRNPAKLVSADKFSQVPGGLDRAKLHKSYTARELFPLPLNLITIHDCDHSLYRQV